MTLIRFIAKLRDKNPKKQHRRIEAHNISKVCEKYPGKYRAPSDVYFGDIDCVFSVFKDIEIDLAVIKASNEIQEEDRKRRDAERQTQQPAYQSPFQNRQEDDADW